MSQHLQSIQSSEFPSWSVSHLDFLGESGREHGSGSLRLIGHIQSDNLPNLGFESHIKHTISLVQNKISTRESMSQFSLRLPSPYLIPANPMYPCSMISISRPGVAIRMWQPACNQSPSFTHLPSPPTHPQSVDLISVILPSTIQNGSDDVRAIRELIRFLQSKPSILIPPINISNTNPLQPHSHLPSRLSSTPSSFRPSVLSIVHRVYSEPPLSLHPLPYSYIHIQSE